MNILFLTKEYNHKSLPNSGGTGVFISTLAKKLVELGHNVFVFSLSNQNHDVNDCGVIVKIKKKKLEKNHIFKLKKSLTRKFSFLQKWYYPVLKLELKEIAVELKKFIKKNKLIIDIIETHDFDGFSLYLDNKIPYVIRCHGSFSIFQKYFNFKNIIQHKLQWEKDAIQKSKNIITVSKYSQKINHELFEIDNSKLIYNGINTDKFIFDKNVSVLPKSIFFVGNLTKEKGADIAAEIFKKVENIYPESSLHFIGIETDYKTKIIDYLEKNNLKNKVIFYGFMDSENLIHNLSKAEIVILPSRGENFSLTVLELMSMSKCVVTSNIPSYSELIINNQNGYIVNSIQDYVDTIKLIFDNKEKAKEIGFQARNTIINNFGIDKMVNQTIEYYQEVIENHKIS